MKRLFAILVTSVAALTAVPSQADAAPFGPSRQYAYNCNRCGSPVFQVPTVVGYDCHGHPVIRMTVASHSCMPRCSSSGPSHHHGHGHSKHRKSSHRH